MPRPPAGIQLGRGVPPGVLRSLDMLVVGILLVTVWGGVSLWSVRTERAEAGPSGTSVRSGPEDGSAAPTLEPVRAQEAAVLLFAGVVDAPDISAALDTVVETAPSGIRIAGLEVRPATGPGQVEAVIAAEAVSAAAVARFLSDLADHHAVLSTEVISETRQTDGTVLVRITAQLDAGRG